MCDDHGHVHVPPVEAVPLQIARLFGETIRDRVRVVMLPEGDVPVRRIPPPEFGRFVPFQDERYDILVSVPFPDSGWLNAQTQISAEPVTWAWASAEKTDRRATKFLSERSPVSPLNNRLRNPRDKPELRAISDWVICRPSAIRVKVVLK